MTHGQATLDVSQASDGRGVISVTRPDRHPVPVAVCPSVEAARALRKGMMGEFSRLVALIPTNALEALMERSQ